CQSQSSHPWTL
nr:immunoglobulin light chain junction region [Macaca mulatta]